MRLFQFLLLVNWSRKYIAVEGYILIPSTEPTREVQIETSKLHIKNHNAFLAVVNGGLPHFHILVRDSSCSLQKTSSFDCAYAVNGGPFQSYARGGCVGLTISDGKVINDTNHSTLGTTGVYNGEDIASVDSNVAFGVTKDKQWILGNPQGYAYSDIQELVTGLNGWLVYNSTIVVEAGGEYAPRTAIGVDQKGDKLVLLQSDGCEHCLWNRKEDRGLTLHDMANAIKDYADYAINLDGGGSSTSVNDGKVINHPTCLDFVNVWCERPVASVVCISL